MSSTPISLAALNAASMSEFMRVLGDVVEHSPWVAERAFAKRPYRSIDDLNAKLMTCIRETSRAEQIELFNQHPELAGREAMAGEMTESSTGEQGRLGLTRLPSEQFQRLAHVSRTHREKFGFPFIVALRLHDALDEVMREGEVSLSNGLEAEIERTLQQISAIVYGRLGRIVC